MIKPLWRYSHFLLAVSSSVFLLLASVTGIILAVEPISNVAKTHSIGNLDRIGLGETIVGLQENYDEILELEIRPSNFVIASVFTRDGESKTVYINPSEFKELGEVEKRSEFFTTVTNLHRSLFLKSIGRFFVGLVSFLLFLIAVTGLLLLIRRQGGIVKLYAKVLEKDFMQRYHVLLGRWFLIPISIIALTGVYLSADRFELLPEKTINHSQNEVETENVEKLSANNFPAFENVFLDEVRKVYFPFSEAPEDYYQVELDNREILVNQYTGTVLSEQKYPFVDLVSNLSLQLHTGQGSVFWSLILLASSASILFFIYSGMAIWLKSRRKNKKTSVGTTDKDQAEAVVLVGSETGTTFRFAELFGKALEKQHKLVHLSTMNNYSTYKRAKKMVLITATYGDGDAPSSAKNFIDRLKSIDPIQKIEFSVVVLVLWYFCH